LVTRAVLCLAQPLLPLQRRVRRPRRSRCLEGLDRPHRLVRLRPITRSLQGACLAAVSGPSQRLPQRAAEVCSAKPQHLLLPPHNRQLATARHPHQEGSSGVRLAKLPLQEAPHRCLAAPRPLPPHRAPLRRQPHRQRGRNRCLGLAQGVTPPAQLRQQAPTLLPPSRCSPPFPQLQHQRLHRQQQPLASLATLLPPPQHRPPRHRQAACLGRSRQRLLQLPAALLPRPPTPCSESRHLLPRQPRPQRPLLLPLLPQLRHQLPQACSGVSSPLVLRPRMASPLLLIFRPPPWARPLNCRG
jgi:hypothetical protein